MPESPSHSIPQIRRIHLYFRLIFSSRSFCCCRASGRTEGVQRRKLKTNPLWRFVQLAGASLQRVDSEKNRRSTKQRSVMHCCDLLPGNNRGVVGRLLPRELTSSQVWLSCALVSNALANVAASRRTAFQPPRTRFCSRASYLTYDGDHAGVTLRVSGGLVEIIPTSTARVQVGILRCRRRNPSLHFISHHSYAEGWQSFVGESS